MTTLPRRLLALAMILLAGMLPASAGHGWRIQYSRDIPSQGHWYGNWVDASGVTQWLWPGAGVRWYFDFPRCSNPVRDSGPQVAYVTHSASTPLPHSGRLVMEYQVWATADAKFVGSEGGTSEGRISMYFQRAGDDWSAKGRYAQYRWYARGNHRVSLKNGIYRMDLPLDTTHWQAVVGGATTETGLRNALSNVSRLGFTFGDRQTAGHGVCLKSGWARFILIDYHWAS